MTMQIKYNGSNAIIRLPESKDSAVDLIEQLKSHKDFADIKETCFKIIEERPPEIEITPPVGKTLAPFLKSVVAALQEKEHITQATQQAAVAYIDGHAKRVRFDRAAQVVGNRFRPPEEKNRIDINDKERASQFLVDAWQSMEAGYRNRYPKRKPQPESIIRNRLPFLLAYFAKHPYEWEIMQSISHETRTAFLSIPEVHTKFKVFQEKEENQECSYNPISTHPDVTIFVGPRPARSDKEDIIDPKVKKRLLQFFGKFKFIFSFGLHYTMTKEQVQNAIVPVGLFPFSEMLEYWPALTAPDFLPFWNVDGIKQKTTELKSDGSHPERSIAYSVPKGNATHSGVLLQHECFDLNLVYPSKAFRRQLIDALDANLRNPKENMVYGHCGGGEGRAAYLPQCAADYICADDPEKGALWFPGYVVEDDPNDGRTQEQRDFSRMEKLRELGGRQYFTCPEQWVVDNRESAKLLSEKAQLLAAELEKSPVAWRAFTSRAAHISSTAALVESKDTGKKKSDKEQDSATTPLLQKEKNSSNCCLKYS